MAWLEENEGEEVEEERWWLRGVMGVKQKVVLCVKFSCLCGANGNWKRVGRAEAGRAKGGSKKEGRRAAGYRGKSLRKGSA